MKFFLMIIMFFSVNGFSQKKCIWKNVVKETGVTDTDVAPFRGKYLGDVWSQWLEAPKAIKGLRRFVNITEYGIFLSHDGHWEKYLNGQEALAEAIRKSGPTFGQKSLSLYDGLMVASKIGMPIMLTLDSSANYWPSGYHDSSRCVSAGRLLCAPLTRPGEMDKAKKLVGDLLGYIEKEWPGLVKYVWWENEAGWLSYTTQRYVDVLRQMVPIIRSKMPQVKIGFDADFSELPNVSGIDVQAVGFHTAIPRESTDQLVAYISGKARDLKSRYPGKEVWNDELGIGFSPWSSYDSAGRDRLIRSIEACYNAGCTGVNFLVIGGINLSKDDNMALYTTDRGESMSVNALKDLSRRYGVAW